MVNVCRALANSEAAQSFILFLIIFSSASMGLETVPVMAEQFSTIFDYFFYLTQLIFVIEITIRLIAHWPNLRNFFNDFWNTFDFSIVTLSLIPGIGAFALIARLLRVLRVLRVFSVSDHLRGFIERLHETLDEIVFTFIIVIVIGYIFAIAGFYSFSEVDPTHWGTLGRSSLSVFYLLLLQGVPSIVDPAISSSGLSIIYFILFYLTFGGLLLSVVNAAISQSLDKRS